MFKFRVLELSGLFLFFFQNIFGSMFGWICECGTCGYRGLTVLLSCVVIAPSVPWFSGRAVIWQESSINRYLFQWEFWYDAEIAKLARFASYFSQLLINCPLFPWTHPRTSLSQMPRTFKLPLSASLVPSSSLMSIFSLGLVSLWWPFMSWASSSLHTCQNFPLLCSII